MVTLGIPFPLGNDRHDQLTMCACAVVQIKKQNSNSVEFQTIMLCFRQKAIKVGSQSSKLEVDTERGLLHCYCSREVPRECRSAGGTMYASER